MSIYRQRTIKRHWLMALLVVVVIYFVAKDSISKGPLADDGATVSVWNHYEIITMPLGTRTRFTGSAPELRPEVEITPETRLILFWTGWFLRRHDDWEFGLGKEPFKKWTCPVRDCVATRDKSLYEQADVIVFNFYGGDFIPAGFPPRRWPDQLYVFVISESPATVGWPVKAAGDFNGFFNLSMTYRHDSDLRYNQILIQRRNHSNNQDKMEEWSSIQQRIKSRGTSRVPVVWMVSNCNTRSRRDRYVMELRKYIDVDVYGKCGTLRCGSSQECYDMFQKKYKFYLSFENSECKDYVTEKLANILPMDLVPVVLGGTNYSRDTPPHSVINVYDFQSPRQLAGYIHELDDNMEKYLEYFKWKLDYSVINSSVARPMSYCKLCEILHSKRSPRPKVVQGMAAFWPPADKVCRPQTILKHTYESFHEQILSFSLIP